MEIRQRLTALSRRVTLDALDVNSAALRGELLDLRASVRSLAAQIEAVDAAERQLIRAWRKGLAQRAHAAAAGGPASFADGVWIDGPSHRRAWIRRLAVGQPVNVKFADRMGVTRAVDAAPDVASMWHTLLDIERAASGGMLHASPGTIFDVGPANISRTAANGALVSLLEPPASDPMLPAIAVPRFAYRRMRRKLRNFGHWLLDYLPQVVGLMRVAPQAVFLMPEPLARFQRATLALVGLSAAQILPWNGEPIAAERMFVFEHDGRRGGGRPLSLLVELQKHLQLAAGEVTPRRRLYVSRRDSKASRRWLANEAAVEALFASRGFDILMMAGQPLEEQVRAFREAHIVAGISGAGLSDIVFSAPDTHLIVLHSESLMRWYAAADRPRAHWWWQAERARNAELAELGDSPRFYAHLAASLGQNCHSFLGPDQIPIDELAGFLDDVLQLAEGRV